MQARDVLFIIGTTRSGSSALTRVLALCGCDLPERVVGPQSFNPTGFWDPIDALTINSEFLLKHGSALGDPEMRFHDVTINVAESEGFTQTVGAFLKSCGGSAPLVIKEQNITSLLAYWVAAAERHGCTPKVIIPVRRPSECILSTRKAVPAFPPERARLMWLKYNLLAERHSRTLPRVFVEYSGLLNDCKGEVCRISKSLGLEESVAVTPAAEQFLNQSLRHHREPDESAGGASPVSRWCVRAYEVLSAAARDQQVDQDLLDEIYESFEASEREFRIARDHFRQHFNPSRVRQSRDELLVWNRGIEF